MIGELIHRCLINLGKMGWPIFTGSLLAVAAVSMTILYFTVQEQQERIVTYQAARKATYDRYMSQCLKDHQEYECVNLLWQFRP